jgi:zinc protease
MANGSWRVAAIGASRSDPGALSNIALEKRLNAFPRGDVRYASNAEEQTEELKAVTLADIRRFHDEFYGASAGEFGVVGQFETAEIRKLAGELFGDWKSPSGYQRIVTAYRKTEPGSWERSATSRQSGLCFRIASDKGVISGTGPELAK